LARSWPDPLRVFVGYDSRQPEAFAVCERSILDHASVPVLVTPLKQEALRQMGLYRRAPFPGTRIDTVDGKPFSTEFTFTRFLVPALMQYEGWALFCDDDMLFRADVKLVFEKAQDNKAVMCVHHDHKPTETTKMEGLEQTKYARKNWSSFMLWNCSHQDNQVLSVDDVSNRPGWWLHRFRWIRDAWKIGVLPEAWNWLEGHSGTDITPDVVHFTRGGPWLEAWKNIPYSDEWWAVHDAIRKP
jgi:lipopolysaccharide biosynthesis glycosyltransferase